MTSEKEVWQVNWTGIATVEAFKKLGEGFGSMRPEGKDVIDKI